MRYLVICFFTILLASCTRKAAEVIEGPIDNITITTKGKNTLIGVWADANTLSQFFLVQDVKRSINTTLKGKLETYPDGLKVYSDDYSIVYYFGYKNPDDQNYDSQNIYLGSSVASYPELNMNTMLEEVGGQDSDRGDIIDYILKKQ